MNAITTNMETKQICLFCTEDFTIFVQLLHEFCEFVGSLITFAQIECYLMASQMLTLENMRLFDI